MGLAAQRFSSGNVSFGTPTAKASYFKPVEALRRATRRSDDARRVGKYISYVCARAPLISAGGLAGFNALAGQITPAPLAAAPERSAAIPDHLYLAPACPTQA